MQDFKIGTAYCMQMTPEYMKMTAERFLKSKELSQADAEHYIKGAKQASKLRYEVVPGCSNYNRKTGRCLGHKD